MSTVFLETDTSKTCTAGCGGVIKKSFFPQCVEDLDDIARQLAVEEYVILGGMSNTLVLPNYEGAAVFTGLLKGISVRGTSIRVKSGESFAKLCGAAQYASLGGLENFFGLPGTVGGAVSGNSGCFGSSISEFVESVTVYKLDTGETEELSGEEIAFGYRYCNLRKNKDLILDVTLSLYREDGRRIAEKMAQTRRNRQISQPKGRSLGCFFKQYRGVSAGYYIEQAGLKGYCDGGVTISPVHANFLINDGGSAENYLRVGEYAAKKVYEKFGIKLEREVIVIGEENRQRDRDR